MSFRLREGERSSRYGAGQFVSADYAARYPHKVLDIARSEAARRGWETRREQEAERRAEQKEKRAREVLEEGDLYEEIEVTVKYGDEE